MNMNRRSRVGTVVLLPFLIVVALGFSQAVGEPGATGPLETATLSGAVNSIPKSESAKILPKLRLYDESANEADFVDRLLAAMTLEEKIGQMCQVFPGGDTLSEDLAQQIQTGQVGSIFFCGSEQLVRDAQRAAVEDSRLGIPLIVARDIVHGFRTVFPIPLGQAASWNPKLVQQAAGVSAEEARRVGIHWTFAPMVDITRDPRWGRIAECVGEDPILASAIGAAMVRGFQSADLEGKLSGIGACPKHFVAYGLAEGGRDYNRVMVSRNELRNTFLRPFKACVDAGALSLMTAFNSVNGVPATGHEYFVRQVLKDEWGFSGFVVSDWASVPEMIKHGFVKDESHAARSALRTGVDMEMVSTCYWENLPCLIASGRVSEELLDEAVRRVLLVKLQLGLFSAPYADEGRNELLCTEHRRIAQELARQSIVMLKNDGVLPLDKGELKSVVVIGPLADSAKDQLGCWAQDGRAEDSITPLQAITSVLGEEVDIAHLPCLRSKYEDNYQGFEAAVAAAQRADVALVFVGEEEALSGEAHSRTNLSLPGTQSELVKALGKLDVPVVMVVMAGRPLTISEEIECVNAVLYAWHPGTMGGPALVDLLLGDASPSGKLPVTFPKSVGQIPLYYNHPNTGRPSPHDYQPPSLQEVKNLPEQIRYKSHYIDSDPFPEFSFGFGLSYSQFKYEDLYLSSRELSKDDVLNVKVRVSNVGRFEATEVVQLYVRDTVANIVRPVKELKDFRRISLKPGEHVTVEFDLSTEALGYYNEEEQFVIEPGEFQLWVGGDSDADLSARFLLK